MSFLTRRANSISETSVDSDDIKETDVKSIIHKGDESVSQLDPEKPSHYTSYTIPVGTTMYHASRTIRTFDTTRINVGTDNYVAFFTPNKDIASSMINRCHPTGESKDGSVQGFVHEFVTIKEIDRIVIVSAYDKELEWTEKKIDKNYCAQRNKNLSYIPNGVGFFIDTKITGDFEEGQQHNEVYHSQFALCNPSEFLEYVGTYSCMSPGILSNDKISFVTNRVV